MRRQSLSRVALQSKPTIFGVRSDTKEAFGEILPIVAYLEGLMAISEEAAAPKRSACRTSCLARQSCKAAPVVPTALPEPLV